MSGWFRVSLGLVQGLFSFYLVLVYGLVRVIWCYLGLFEVGLGSV
jgi:hypothetical protein